MITENFSRFYENYLLNTFFKRSAGSYEGSRERLRNVFNNPKSTKKDKVDILKEEYGTGGTGYKGFNCDYNSKGVILCRSYFNKFEFTYSWSKIVQLVEDRTNRGERTF